MCEVYMARTSKKVEKVYQEANELYNGKNFKDGTALFQHVLNIFEFCRSENEKIVALLSEVFNYNLLSEKDFLYRYGNTVYSSVKVLTDLDDDTEASKLQRIKQNAIARAVQVAEYKYLMSIHKMDESEFQAKLGSII